MEVSGTQNGGFPEPYIRLLLGVRKLPYISRIHTAYIGFRSSILGTVPEMFGDWMCILEVRIKG